MTKHGTAYFAREQTAGKGQRSKTWNSAPGQNIVLSLVIIPEGLGPHQTFLLSAAVALATYEFFAVYAGDETKIKWPNDIYWRDRKAGGILIENGIRGADWGYSIVGIGININQTKFPEDVINGVSLKQITARNFDSEALARELCSFISRWYELLVKGETGELLKMYHERLYKLGDTVKLKSQNRLFEATILGVTDEGKLRVQAGDMEINFSVGELEFIVPSS